MDFSVIIPAYNEEENIVPLYDELKKALKNIGDYEIIFIDDGSKDGTLKAIKDLSRKDKIVKYISFAKNFGKTQAMAAGMSAAKGSHIITLDADLQDPPEEISKLIQKLKEKNYDCVSGWRKHRKHSIEKKFFSRIFFFLRKIFFKDKIHDANCMLKVYKKECFKDFEFYGDVHRFITTILQLKGYKVGECVIQHRKRYAGVTKYGARRLTRGFLDLLFIKFWNVFSTRPLHFFGNLAFFQYFLSFVIFVEQVIKAIIYGGLKIGPLLLLVAMLFLNATITFFFGFLAEMVVRSNRSDKHYELKESNI